MIQATCINKFKEKNKIVAYLVKTKEGRLKHYTPLMLKRAIKNKEIIIDNLTLTKNNRLIESKTEEDTKGVNEKEDIERVKQYIGKMRLMGRVKEIATKCDHTCYLVSQNKYNHILYIPANVKVLNMIGKEFTKYLLPLDGVLRVYGGEGLVNANSMFEDCCFYYIDFTHFKTNEIKGMVNMFKNSKINFLDLSSFNTKNVKYMTSMFENCRTDYMNLSSIRGKNVTVTQYMFRYCSTTTLDLSSFGSNKITNMESMFEGCAVDNLILNNFDTKNCYRMSHMFDGCIAPTIDLSSFSLKNVENIDGMFVECITNCLNLSSFGSVNPKNLFFAPDASYIVSDSLIDNLILPKDTDFSLIIQQSQSLKKHNTKIVLV